MSQVCIPSHPAAGLWMYHPGNLWTKRPSPFYPFIMSEPVLIIGAERIAKHVGVPPATLRRWIEHDGFPAGPVRWHYGYAWGTTQTLLDQWLLVRRKMLAERGSRSLFPSLRPKTPGTSLPWCKRSKRDNTFVMETVEHPVDKP